MRFAGQRPGRVVGICAVLVAVTTRLVVAELAGVEHVEVRKPPPVEPAIDPDVRTTGERGSTQRHVLVVGLERCGSSVHESWHRGGVVRSVGGPVVVDLVIVEDHQPRRHGVGSLQVRVGAVLGVPLPVVGQRDGLRAAVVAHAFARWTCLVLVLVVTEVEHQVGLVLRESTVGREPPGLVARDETNDIARDATVASYAGAVRVRRPGRSISPAGTGSGTRGPAAARSPPHALSVR